MGRWLPIAALSILAVATAWITLPQPADAIGDAGEDPACLTVPADVSAPEIERTAESESWLAARPPVGSVAPVEEPSLEPEGDDFLSECDAKDTRRRVPLAVIVKDSESGREMGCLSPEPVPVNEPYETTEVSWSVLPEPGFVLWDSPKHWSPISRYARALVAVYALRREVDVEIRVLEETGNAPDPESLAVDFTIADRTWRPVLETASRGVTRLRGVPHLRGEPWALYAGLMTSDGTRTAFQSGTLDYEAGIPLRAEMVLPSFLDPPGRAGSGSSRHFCCGGGCRRCVTREGPTGTLDLRVLRRDGSPAFNACVRLVPSDRDLSSRSWKLDADGRSHGSILSTGRWAVRVDEPGILRFETEISVGADTTTTLDLQEPQGGGVLVIVEDEKGRPLPHPTINVRQSEGGDWFELSGDRQRIDKYGDQWGRRLCEHVQPGKVQVTAWYGSRKGEAEVVVLEGRETPVRVRVSK